MSAPDDNTTRIYTVNTDDKIIDVHDSFWTGLYDKKCENNDAISEEIRGHSIWDYIKDVPSREIYRVILQRVRMYKKAVTFFIRCDTSSERRLIQLFIIPNLDGSVKFESSIVSSEKREYIELLNPNREHTNELLKICSMCKKVATGKTSWDEIEVAIQKMRLFERKTLPQLTHGYCPSCIKIVYKELESMKTDYHQ